MPTTRRPRTCSSPRPLRSVRRSGRASALVTVVALVVAGCVTPSDEGAEEPPGGASSTSESTRASGDGIVLVLPPADGLADAERVRLRELVEDVMALPTGGVVATVLEPTTTTSLADTVDIAVRRVGGDGTICLLGTGGRAALSAVLARYPAARACVVPGPPPSGAGAGRVATEDVDLLSLGQALGLAAHAAAGDGSVLLLDGGDALLDVRFRRGVEEAVLGAAGSSGPAFGVVTTAAEALALLDGQAESREEGGVADGGVPEGREGLLPDDPTPTARSLRPVAVVILDAGPAAAALAPSLAERGIPVVVPTVLLEAGLVSPQQVVLHWSVRWDVPLVAALGRHAGGSGAAAGDPVLLVPGPAAVTP